MPTRGKCKVDCSLFHDHRQILWVGPINPPTRALPLWLGQMESMVLLHGLKSESVGCLLGHVIFDHASPGGRRESISGFILFLNAKRMSNMNSSCWYTLMSLRRWSMLLEYPQQMSTCMMNSLLSRRKAVLKLATTALTVNLDPRASSSTSGLWDAQIECRVLEAVGTKGLTRQISGSRTLAWIALLPFDSHSASGAYLT